MINNKCSYYKFLEKEKVNVVPTFCISSETSSKEGLKKVVNKLFEKVKYNGWKICLRVCYDLRFPVWSRNNENYDLLIYVANWPSPRINAWDRLLCARAIENCCYSVGVNCIGEDPNNNKYPGHSSAYDYYGNLISDKLSNNSENINISIDLQSLLKYRKKFGFLKDQDSFELY